MIKNYGIGQVTFNDDCTKEYTKDPMTVMDLGDNGYLVVATNKNGAHGGGSANFAYNHLDLPWGFYEGIIGRCYAIPTLNYGNTQKLSGKYYNTDFKVSEEELLESLIKLNECVVKNRDKKFYLTRIGLGIAGFDLYTIHKLFWTTSLMCNENLIYPRDFEALDDMF